MKDNYLNSNVFAALVFASDKHKYQRRKGFTKIPYINHPIRVTKLIIEALAKEDEELVIAAILHDVVEDTDASKDDIILLFGQKIANLVMEVTDDMALPYDERKRLQIEKAPKLSAKAKLIKIADKISNISDLIEYPIDWSNERKLKYVNWSIEVVEHCRGLNEKLDKQFDAVVNKAVKVFQKLR